MEKQSGISSTYRQKVPKWFKNRATRAGYWKSNIKSWSDTQQFFKYWCTSWNEENSSFLQG